MVHLAHQPGLALDRGLELRLVAGDGSGDVVERGAEIADLARRRPQPRQIERPVAGR